MAESLPRFVALGQGAKYLRYVLEDGELHSRMQLISDHVVSEKSFTKLEILSAESSAEQLELVHIRSSYNNKFLVRSSETQNWIVAGADEPEEDRSKWSCTLFRVQVTTNKDWTYVTLFLQAADGEHGVEIDGAENCLTIGRNSVTGEVFRVTDLASLAILPKYVAFKGDNNNYLTSRHILTHERLKFDSTNVQLQRVHHETFILPDGNVRIKSNSFKRYWRKSGSRQNYVWADNNDSTGKNKDTVFRPVRLDSTSNKIALMNMGNNKYCRRLTDAPLPKLKGTLAASSSNVTPQVVMRVEEAVREREIYDVQYRVDDARIYDVGLVNNVIQTTSNWSPTSTAEKQLGFTYTKMTQETFSSSHSWKVKMSVQIKAKLPALAQGVIKMEASYQGSVSWSEMKSTTEEVNSFVNVSVPPMTKVEVTMLIGRGSIDVPFSYTQRDILLNGTVVTDRMHDGLFSGLSTEMIDYSIKEETLSEEEATLARAAAALSLSSKL